MKFIANSDEAVLQKNLSRIMYDKRGNETNEESLAVSQSYAGFSQTVQKQRHITYLP